MHADILSEPTILDLLQDLIRTPSVNPTLAPDESNGEAAIAQVAETWFHNHGVNAWLEEVAPGRPNTVAEIGDASGPTLVFCAHIDTVATKGMDIPTIRFKR